MKKLNEIFTTLLIFVSIIIVGTIANLLLIPVYVQLEFFKPIMLSAPLIDKILISMMFSYLPFIFATFLLTIITIILPIILYIISKFI